MCSFNQFCRGKVICVIYYESMVVALFIEHAIRMRCILLSLVACLALPYFSTLSVERARFSDKVFELKTYFFISSTVFVGNISYCKNNLARYYHKYTYRFVRSTNYFCQILINFEFSLKFFSKSTHMYNLIKIFSVGADLFHVNRETDRQMLQN